VCYKRRATEKPRNQWINDCELPDRQFSTAVYLVLLASRQHSPFGGGNREAEFCCGAVWGNANCNSTNGGTRGTVSDSLVIENGGKYCWCQATGFKAANGTSMYQYESGPTCNVHSVSSFWVFDRNYVGATRSCESDCTYDCAAQARGNSGFRVALFGAVK